MTEVYQARQDNEETSPQWGFRASTHMHLPEDEDQRGDGKRYSAAWKYQYSPVLQLVEAFLRLESVSSKPFPSMHEMSLTSDLVLGIF
jgi:hypothetical protein